tara:strand:- start:765 stop:2243 length:1479 start_codon:yes stop_codon:yes gene_type:complete
MAADKSLIQAALAEARSRKGIDKTPFYEAELDVISKTTTGIIDFISKKEKAKENGFNSIAGEVEGMLRKLSGSSEQLGGMHEANVQKLKDLKQKYLSVYGDADKEKEVMFEIEQIATEINGLVSGFGKFGEAYVNESIDVKSTNPSFYNIFGKVWDKDGDYSDLNFSWSENNKLQITVDGETQNFTDLFDGIELIDDKPLNDLGVIGGKLNTAGTKNDNKTFKDYKGESLEAVNKLMNTKGKFSNIITKGTFGEISYIDALATMFDDDKTNDNKEMTAILKNLGLDTSIENKTILFEALTDIHSKNFDYDTAKKLAVEWYTEGYLKSKFDDGKTQLNNALSAQINKNNTGGTYTIGKQAVAKEAIDYSINLLNSNKDFPNHQAWNGVLYKRENGKYYLYEKGEPVVKTKDQVASAIGVLRPDLGYKGMQTGGNDLEISEQDRQAAKNIEKESQVYINGQIRSLGDLTIEEVNSLSPDNYKKYLKYLKIKKDN